MQKVENEKPSRSKIFRDKMRVEKERQQTGRTQQLPVHKRIRSQEETR